MNTQMALEVLPAYKTWTPVALGLRLGTASHTAQRHLQRLVRCGLARPCLVVAYQLTPEGVMAARAGGADSKERRFIPRTPAKPRAVSTFRQRAWQAARMLEKFTVADVLQLAGDSGEPTSQAARDGDKKMLRIAREYLNGLCRAGVLRRMRSGHSARNARYFLLRDLGPAAPVWRKRTHDVVDGNSGRILPCARKTEVAA
jgi:hypothetical protein